MARGSIGFQSVINELRSRDENRAAMLRKAASYSMALIKKNARLLLTEYYQTVPKADYERERTGLLYKSFRAKIDNISDQVVEAMLVNTAPEALWLEQGTETHWVAPNEAQAMAWPIPDGMAFSKGHMISGITPLEFMKEAMQMSRPAILEIFRQIVVNPQIGGSISLGIGSDIVSDDDNIGESVMM
jgi:hypothetical protein